jgi:hypothetical protein
VGIQGHSASEPAIGAQLVSQSGTLVGSYISTGRTGGAPLVAFDGTNYLLVWPDDATYPNDILYGQLISKAGATVGSPFIIGQPVSSHGAIGLVFDGNNYFVAWPNAGGGDSVDIYGQFITKSGELLGSPLAVTTAVHQQRDGAVAFDGTNILIAFADGRRNIFFDMPCGEEAGFPTDIYGQFITKSGAGAAGSLLGSNFVINENGYPNDNPLSVAFDGTNYLVLWNDETIIPTTCVEGNDSGGEWDLYGQLIDKSGNKVGDVIPISTATGTQSFPSIAFDGTDYLAAWTDLRNDADGNWSCDSGEGKCIDIYGQLISPTGNLVGSEFIIDNDSGNQLAFIGFSEEKYLAIISTILSIGSEGMIFGDVYGAFLTPDSESVDYFPLSTGNRWVYKSSGDEGHYRVDTIIGQETVNGVPTYIKNRQDQEDPGSYNEKKWLAKDNTDVKLYKI